MVAKLKIRVDDFLWTKENERYRHNLENFKLFDEVMQKYNLEYVLGVIPSNCTEEDLKWLAQQKHINVALHGIKHDERFLNEFRDYETEMEIFEKLSKSFDFLLKYFNYVHYYIPPHNVIDCKTINALRKLDLSDILGGPETDIQLINYALEQGMGLHLSLPPYFYGRSDELLQRGSVEKIKEQLVIEKSKLIGDDVWLTIHWTWGFNVGLDSLNKYLTELLNINGK